MSSLRIFLCLALGLSINTSIASESFNGSNSVFLQDQQPIVIAGRPDDRERGDCEAKTPPNVWTLDICQSHSCYVNPNEVSLWLAERPDRTVKVSVENQDTLDSAKLSWKKSVTTLDWPKKKVPIYSNTSYKVRVWNRIFKFEKEISLHQIPAEHKTIDAQAKWMKENGCQAQTKMLKP